MTDEGWTLAGPSYQHYAERIFRDAPNKNIDLTDENECREHVGEMAEMLSLEEERLWDVFRVYAAPLWAQTFMTGAELYEDYEG